MENAVLRFLAPFVGLGTTTYEVRLGLIGKHVDYLLALIKLFSLGVTAESIRAKIDRKLAISLQPGHTEPKFQVEGVALHQSFLHGELGVRPMMPYNFVDDKFSHKKNFVADFLQRSAVLRPAAVLRF